MEKKIKFSVITPVYNVQNYLPECLGSIIGQTMRDIEIICVDNGSTDKSLSILKQYAKKDKRIKVLEIGKADAGTARNAGLDVAVGEYLYFIDSDDYCEKDLLEKAYEVITREKSDVLVFRADRFDSATGKRKEMWYSLVEADLPKERPFRPEAMRGHLFNSFQNWPWNKVFRRSFIEEKKIRFQEVVRANDVLFVYLALAQAEKISVLDEVLIHYRVGNKNSLQSTNHLAPVAFWDAYRETKKALQRIGLYEKYEKSYLNETMKGILYNYNAVKTNEAKEYIFALIRYGSEIEFGFLKHGRNYYDDKEAYSEYCEIMKTEHLSDLEADRLKEKYKHVLKENSELKETNCQLDKGIKEIRASRAYKVGMAVTDVPRKIKSLINHD